MSQAQTLQRGLARFDIGDPFEEIMAAVDADGAAIVQRFVTPDLLSRLNRELDAAIEDREPGSKDVGPFMGRFWGQNTKRFTRLAAIAPAFAELVDHDFMHAWAQRSFEADYWLNTGQAMIVGPGEPAQYLHRDVAIWPFIEKMGLQAPDALVSILLALSDFTEEVGATRIIPGSNRWTDFHRQPDPGETVGAIMPAGSAVLYAGKTVHAAGANVTPATWRRGLHMSFCLGWLTPEEANPISVPWEIAKGYPPRVQRMLGYASAARLRGAAATNWLVNFEDVRKHLGVPFERPTKL